MVLLKILMVFALIMIVLQLKQPLFLGLIGGIIAAVLLFGVPIASALAAIWNSVVSLDTLLLLLALYLVFYVQAMMIKRGQVADIEQSLNTLFNNRRVNSSLVPAALGVLPSSAIVYTCGAIVKKATDGYLNNHEQAVVASFFRHIPESFLPTFANILIGIQLSQIATGMFMLSMLIPLFFLFLLGHLFFLRKVPRETGESVVQKKSKALLQLLRGLWVLIFIVALILLFGLHVSYAALIGIAAFAIVYKCGPHTLWEHAKTAFEPKILFNTVMIMAFKGVLTQAGALEEMAAYMGQLHIAPWFTFMALFFIGTVIAGSQAITVVGIPLAFSTMPNGGFPLLMLLMCSAYAAMQFSPTHICIMMACDYFKSPYGTFVKKMLPMISVFLVLIIGYYFLLTSIA